ncbi:ABC transporter permease [Limnochorda pilosa]|uniref:Transport permease protein n=1 Tax=Limnochorda pilosa TaxID=1555112 RepID=A0A0K2SHL5_LIMPI|nr:ABC transporter permease [Limnochorda pilosa]BAS26598.1 multidrug ABC transporter permease [Limnochorda pilosa]
MTFVADTYHLLVRRLRTRLRTPVWIAVGLVQPVIWLGVFGQLFRRVVEIPGFEGTSYVQFLTPGVVVMTAFFGGLWSGMGLIQDLNDGVLDRLLATPVRRGALIAAPVLEVTLTATIQSGIILLTGLALGARFTGGLAGPGMILLASALLGAGAAGFSNGLALVTRREDALIPVVNFVGMPLTFLSSAFMAEAFMPGWIRAIARVNPLNWAITSARSAMLDPQWPQIWLHVGYLLLFVLVGGFLATQAFRAYQRST